MQSVTGVPSILISFSEEDRREILQRVDRVLQTGKLTLGEYTREFEDSFAHLHSARLAVAVNSGTSALEIILRALGIPGREVLVPANTFFATPSAVLHAGNRVRFLDVAPDTFSITVDEIRKKVTEETAAIIVVHIGGMITPEIPDIRDFCRQRGLFLVEDAAHAHGATYKGRFSGTFGDAAAFSFYPTKVVTSAEGGMILTEREEIYDEALIYRDQGKADFSSNYHVRLGYNWRLSEIHAIIGCAQLKRLNESIAARRMIAHIYDETLKNVRGVTPLLEPSGVRSNYYKYVALLDSGIDREHVKQLLKDRFRVALAGEVYAIPCHKQPVFAPYAEHALPVAEDICARHICLPIFPTMSTEQAAYVVDALDQAVRETTR